MSRKDKEIMIICPSIVVRVGLSHILNGESGLKVVETAGNLSPLVLSKIEAVSPDAVIIDPASVNPGDLTSLRSSMPALEACVLAAMLNAAYTEDILAQFDTVFSLSDSPNIIINRLRTAICSQRNEERSSSNGLTAREKDIVIAVAKGLTNKEIADSLCLSIHTVTTHRKNISQKLGIRSIAGLAVYAIMNGLLSEEDL